MHLKDGSLLSRYVPRWGLSHVIFTPIRVIHTYLYSFDNIFALGLFTSTITALISHKIMIILLHKPLSASGVILTAPCLFLFDLITLLLLYWGFASRLTIIKLLAALISILVVICSAAFASMYIQGNVELNWTRSVEVSYPYSLANVVKVLVHWKFFKNLMAEGHNSFGKVLALYALAGGTLVVLRMLLVAAKSQRHYQLAPSREKPEIVETLGFFETFVAAPLIRSVFVLLIITLLLPP